jgi:hypothetical protein
LLRLGLWHDMIRDARGQRVRAVSLRELRHGDDRDPDGRRRNVVKIVRKLHSDLAWSITGANFIWLCLFVFVWNRFEERLFSRNVFQGWTRVGAILATFASIAAVCTWLGKRRAARRRADAALEAGFCGSCGYDLQGTHFSLESTRVTCPECGSMWRSSSISANGFSNDATQPADTISP